jgi:hypothetical protein
MAVASIITDNAKYWRNPFRRWVSPKKAKYKLSVKKEATNRQIIKRIITTDNRWISRFAKITLLKLMR